MIQKWDLTAAPFEKDPERHKVRLRASREELERLLTAIPQPCSEPFVTLAKDFNWFFYLPSLSADRHAQVLEVLKNFGQGHVIHGEDLAPRTVAAPENRRTEFPRILAPAAPSAAPAPVPEASPPPEGSSASAPVSEAAPAETMGVGILSDQEDSVIVAQVKSHIEQVQAEAPTAAAPAVLPVPEPISEPAPDPAPAPAPAPAPVEERDSGIGEITLIEYVGFYPEANRSSFERLRPLLEEQIKKFKLKIQLSEAASVPYEQRPEMNMAFLKDGCASKQCYRALFLGPFGLDAAAEAKFQKDVQSAAANAHVTLHWLGSAGLQRESEILNCALEMTIPSSRLTANQAPHKRF